jgi:hypothetical protein
MAQSAEDLRRGTSRSQSQQFTATPSTALAKITEVVDQVRTLTGRSKRKDALWDVTKLTLRALRDKLNSGLWLLRALWYAEPIQLVTIGRWMSRTDKETTKEINALHAYIRARDDYRQIETTDDEYEDARQRQSNWHAPDTKKTTLTYGVYNHHTGNTPSRYRDTPLPHDKYRNNVTRRTPRADDCWPPVGKCQSCGFYPEQRAGDMCIALAKRRSHCEVDHTEKTCDNTPELQTFKADIRVDGDNTINETTTTNASEDEEVHPPQDTAPDEQGNSKEQHDARPTGPEDRKPHHRHCNHRTDQNVTQATTKDTSGTAAQEIETDTPHTLRRHHAEKGPIKSFETTNTMGPPANAPRTSTATRISKEDGGTTLGNTNRPKRHPRPRPDTENRESHDYGDMRTYPWAQQPETTNTSEATTTYELSAARLSLEERVGIGDNSAAAAPTRREDPRNPRKQTVS